jgi:alkyl sulfatase BDS1-like metallo-beta-lactamase superfamily hydrolase
MHPTAPVRAALPVIGFLSVTFGFTINLITPDNGERFLVELENATLMNIKGFLARNPNLTLTINRSDLEHTMMGAKTLEVQIADGTAKVEGDAGIFKQLASTMVDFDPLFAA